MAKQDQKLIDAAQKRGATLTEADDSGWHGSYVHDGQEYTLDADTLEELSDDMNALIDILTQDDTYQVDYNEDTDRYIVNVEGFDEPFSDKVLAKAFASAKGALMDKMDKAEKARQKAEVKAAPTKTNGPEQQVLAPQTGAPSGTAEAIEAAVNAFRNALLALGGLPQRSVPSIEGDETPPIPPAPKRKRGIGKSA